MIALVPTDADAARMAVEGFEAPEQLHVTLSFLGAAIDWDDDARLSVLEHMASVARRTPPITATLGGVAVFAMGEQPCAVYLPSDGKVQAGGPLAAVHARATASLDELPVPAQFSPWTAHIAIGYGLPIDRLDQAGTQVTFDRIRVAFAGVNMDFDLVGEQAAAAESRCVAAGVAVVARDTGRVLMLQRSLSDDDPAAGMWEVPGGNMDEEEGEYDAALREFAEETGHPCPGVLSADWLSPNGVYHLFAHVVDSEADVKLNLDPEDRMVGNPDDPDGDEIEVLAWWDPEHIDGNDCLREECRSWFPWSELRLIAG